MTRLEICCGDILSLERAVEGGANRVELCSGLQDGGVTPPLSMIRRAVALGIESVNVLVRPRGGDFLYTPTEVDAMICDIESAVAEGATGIVCGALTADGDLDVTTLRRLIGATAGKDFIFHRAFDVCRNPFEALRILKSEGAERVLTSGCAATAFEGRDMLRRLVDAASGEIRIMAGAGVTVSNAADILSTGVDAIHSTARSTVESGMKYRNRDVAMGTPGCDEYAIKLTDPAIVRALRESLN